jgi:hypothetical protein
MSNHPEEDDHNQQIIADIKEYGWHVVGVREDEEGPPFAYTIGFYRTLKHPEIILLGLDLELTHPLLNNLGDAIRGGQRYETGQEYEDILEAYCCMFRTVSTEFYNEFLGCGVRFYQGLNFPALQCVWPDKAQKYPWEEGFNPHWLPRQPILDPALVHLSHQPPTGQAVDPDWPFPGPRNEAVITTKPVMREGLPILYVTHDRSDGGWQFLCGTTNRTEDGMVVALSTVVRHDPSIRVLADLPEGWCAWREGPGQPWLRAPHEETEE